MWSMKKCLAEPFLNSNPPSHDIMKRFEAISFGIDCYIAIHCPNILLQKILHVSIKRRNFFALTPIIFLSPYIFTIGYRKCSLQRTPISIETNNSQILMYRRFAWEIFKMTVPRVLTQIFWLSKSNMGLRNLHFKKHPSDSDTSGPKNTHRKALNEM